MGKKNCISWSFPDWKKGVELFSRSQKGCYMDLLTAQFDYGHLSIVQIKKILGRDFKSNWETLSIKFKQDSNGNFYNKRLDSDIASYLKFLEKQKTNGALGGRKNKPKPLPSLTQALPQAFAKPNEIVQNPKENADLTNNICNEILNSNIWKESIAIKQKMTIQSLNSLIKTFLDRESLKSDFCIRPIQETKDHFINWLTKNKDKFNGTQKQAQVASQPKGFPINP